MTGYSAGLPAQSRSSFMGGGGNDFNVPHEREQPVGRSNAYRAPEGGGRDSYRNERSDAPPPQMGSRRDGGYGPPAGDPYSSGRNDNTGGVERGPPSRGGPSYWEHDDRGAPSRRPVDDRRAEPPPNRGEPPRRSVPPSSDHRAPPGGAGAYRGGMDDGYGPPRSSYAGADGGRDREAAPRHPHGESYGHGHGREQVGSTRYDAPSAHRGGDGYESGAQYRERAGDDTRAAPHRGAATGYGGGPGAYERGREGDYRGGREADERAPPRAGGYEGRDSEERRYDDRRERSEGRRGFGGGGESRGFGGGRGGIREDERRRDDDRSRFQDRDAPRDDGRRDGGGGFGASRGGFSGGGRQREYDEDRGARSGGFGGERRGDSGRNFGGDFESRRGGFGGSRGGDDSRMGGRSFGGGRDRDEGGDRGGGRYGGSGSGFGGSRGGGFSGSRGGGFGGGGGGGRFGGSGRDYDDDSSSFGRGGGGFGGGGGRGRNDNNDEYRGRVFERSDRSEEVERAPRDWMPEVQKNDILFAADRQNQLETVYDEDSEVTVNGAAHNDRFESWDHAPIDEILRRTCKEKCGYPRPRNIQSAFIPQVLDGRDVLGQAETGSGKTAAFALPILHMIMEKKRNGPEKSSHAPYALILSPTRDLTEQLFGQLCKFADGTDLKICRSYGQLNRGLSASEIARGCDILVGCIGRINDLIGRNDVTLQSIMFFVLDECDRLLEQNSAHEIMEIANHHSMPPVGERQTLMLSATINDEFMKVASRIVADKHVIIRAKNGNKRVKHEFIEASGVKGKNDVLFDILRDARQRAEAVGQPMPRTLIFVNLKRMARIRATDISKADILGGLEAQSISGDCAQDQRHRLIREIDEGKVRVLVGTDLCERGLDIHNLDLVINYDMPSDIDRYTHRVGRTGRIKPGRAVSIIDPSDSACLAILGSIIERVEQVGQEVPQFMRDLKNGGGSFRAGGSFGSSSFGRSGGAGGGSGGFSRGNGGSAFSSGGGGFSSGGGGFSSGGGFKSTTFGGFKKDETNESSAPAGASGGFSSAGGFGGGGSTFGGASGAAPGFGMNDDLIVEKTEGMKLNGDAAAVQEGANVTVEGESKDDENAAFRNTDIENVPVPTSTENGDKLDDREEQIQEDDW